MKVKYLTPSDIEDNSHVIQTILGAIHLCNTKVMKRLFRLTSTDLVIQNPLCEPLKIPAVRKIKFSDRFWTVNGVCPDGCTYCCRLKGLYCFFGSSYKPVNRITYIINGKPVNIHMSVGKHCPTLAMATTYCPLVGYRSGVGSVFYYRIPYYCMIARRYRWHPHGDNLTISKFYCKHHIRQDGADFVKNDLFIFKRLRKLYQEFGVGTANLDWCIEEMKKWSK